MLTQGNGSLKSVAAAAILGFALAREGRVHQRMPQEPAGLAHSRHARLLVIPAVYEEIDLVRGALEHFRDKASTATSIVVVTAGPGAVDVGDLGGLPENCAVWVSEGAADKGSLITAYLDEADLQDSDVIGIYDVDSRPTCVGGLPRGKEVAQQLCLYEVAVRSTKDWRRTFWGGCATNQTLWSMTYERATLERGRDYYFVGHGLLMEAQLARALPFRRFLPGEDLLMGYQASLDGIRPAFAEGLDRATAPDSITEFLRQNERWFLGEVTALLALPLCWDSTRLRVRRIAGLLNWVGGPPLILVAASYTWTRSRVVALCLSGAFLASRWVLYRDTERIREVGAEGSETCVTPIGFAGFVCKPLLGSVAALSAALRMSWDRGWPRRMQKARKSVSKSYSKRTWGG